MKPSKMILKDVYFLLALRSPLIASVKFRKPRLEAMNSHFSSNFLL